MTNELTITTNSIPAPRTFINDKLNACSERIYVILTGAQAASEEVANILAEVYSSKCYTDDGFKSVGDYAEQCFGMKQSQAYRLARSAARFRSEDSVYKDNPVTSCLSLAKLDELTPLSDDDITAGIESGEISESSSQDSLREYAKAHNQKERKPRERKEDKWSLCYSGADWKADPDFTWNDTPFYKSELEGEVKRHFTAEDGFTTIRINDTEDGRPRWYAVALDGSGITTITAYISVPYVAPEKPNKTKNSGKSRKYSSEEVNAAIEAYQKEHDGQEPPVSVLMQILRGE